MESTMQTESHKLIDRHGRVVDYLRISLTDRCNLKCLYCHPPHKIEYLDRSKICSYGEILRVVEVACRLGIEKVRLTGGEPFIRKEVIKFMDSLCQTDQLKDVALTTNGTLLLPHLKRLEEMGIKRINISLDTLSEELYFQITGCRELSTVLEAIDRALEEGFMIKINMVVLRGVNEDEIPDFIRYFLKNSAEVRFIEYMPLCGHGWKKDYFFPYKSIMERMTRYFDLRPLSSSGVAQEFFLSEGNGIEGKVGIIAPLSRPFCSSCSRLRLSASGELRPCLFSSAKIELLPLLRDNLSPQEREKRIEKAFKQAVRMKPFSMPSADEAGDNIYIHSLGG
ncbi:MAG: GTP 3',8-cyclase MoaA [Candidatus Aminicenantales bacterium]